MHKLMRELLALVPPDGSAWPDAARQRWIAAMSAVLDVLYEDGPPSAPAVASDTMAAGQALSLPDEPLEEATRIPGLPPTWPPAETSSVDLRPSRMPASTQGRHARPSASND